MFHNRLAKGMRLETDPTVMYATMLRSGGRWSRNITKKDLRTPHPYNTYAVHGLPPGPARKAGIGIVTLEDIAGELLNADIEEFK